MSKWLEGRVAGQTRWTERLLSLRVEAPFGPFEAGQFAKLALDVGGERIARPYSLVNPPGATPLEFFYNVVAAGPLSPRLAALEAGDTVYVAPNPGGLPRAARGAGRREPVARRHRHGAGPFPLHPAHRGAVAALCARDARACDAHRRETRPTGR
jgi:ferredoxin/flavodoxin---NADP+ reductase